jgi:hypothetical protein
MSWETAGQRDPSNSFRILSGRTTRPSQGRYRVRGWETRSVAGGGSPGDAAVASMAVRKGKSRGSGFNARHGDQF